MGKTTFIKNLFASYARDPDFKVASASTPTSREARCPFHLLVMSTSLPALDIPTHAVQERRCEGQEVG